MIISVSEIANTELKISLDGLNFLNSYWMFYGVNVEILNCHTASLVLELKYIINAIIQNCTFGNWTFKRVQNMLIKDCNNIFDFPTTLNFINSSAYVENITIQHENIMKEVSVMWVDDHSSLHVEQSHFVNNTVNKVQLEY